MLERVDLSQKVSRDEYRRRRDELRDRIFDLHRAGWEHGVGVLVVLEGVEASGRGDAIRALTRRMEPRGFAVHTVAEPRSSTRGLPWLWRFWGMVPPYGSMAIFDQSWYRRLLIEGVEGTLTEADARRTITDINSFEKTLADDGYLFVKLFLLISAGEQRRRLEELESDELTAWQVTADDWRRHDCYRDHVEAADLMLAYTESEWAPWTIVAAEDRRACRLEVMETLAERLERRLGADGGEVAARTGEP